MPVLTDDELIYTLEIQLPELLERRPELEPRLYGAFLKTFVRKEEVAAILQELREFRGEFNTFQDEVDEFRGEFDTFRDEVDQRFEQVDQRFEQVDQRLDGIDQRLDGIDQRFEQVDQRFEQVDQRFEQMDQRFEQMDQRFEQVDQRFEGIDQRIDSLQAEMRASFQDLRRSIDRLGSRWGIRIESVFRQTMVELLERSFGVRVEQRNIGGEQFDVVIFDDQHILVEIASSVGPGIQPRLERKRDLYTQATGVAPARFILATAGIHSRRAQALREAGFEVVEPEEEEEAPE